MVDRGTRPTGGWNDDRGDSGEPTLSLLRPVEVDRISHAHARLIAYCWEERERPDHALTVLARTGAIRADTEPQLARDLHALVDAARQSSDPGETVCVFQIRALHDYVLRHGPRDPVPGWAEVADDGEFVARTRAFARARRRHLSAAPRTERPAGHSQHQTLRVARDPAATRDGGAPPRGSAPAGPGGFDAHPTLGADTPPAAEPPSPTVYEQLGGAPAIRAAVDLFYTKVLGDDRVNHYFDDINIARLKAHQRAMITAVAGGPQDVYDDVADATERLRQAHAGLGITRNEFSTVVGHLVTTLVELGVDTDVVDQLAPTVLGLRDVIVTARERDPFTRESKEHAMDQTVDTTDSIYERIGGAPAVRAAVDLFYEKVLADDSVNHHFDDINIARLKAHQRAMITAVAGGPNEYSGRSMADAHQHLGISNGEFDTVVGHLVATLQELGVPPDDIDTMAPTVLDLRDDIVSA